MRDRKSSKFIFSTGLGLLAELEQGNLSKDFRQQFLKCGISLSSRVTVELEAKDYWRLRDIDTSQMYLIEKTDNELKIYSIPRTDVILIVKGAGLHKSGDTLDLFIQGFWPALKKLLSSKDNTRVTRPMIRQEHEILQDYKPPPHIKKEHIYLAEISVSKPSPLDDNESNVSQQILVKEAYWELGQKQTGRWKALFNEWHMATYALRRELTNWFRSLTFSNFIFRSLVSFLATVWKGSLERIPSRFDGTQRQIQSFVKKVTGPVSTRIRDLARKLVDDLEFFFIYLSFFSIYLFLGTILLIALQKDKLIALIHQETAANIWHLLRDILQTFFSTKTIEIFGIALLFASVISFFMSWKPSLQILNRGPNQVKRLPGLQRWILVPMIVTFIFNTWGYLLFFILFLIPIVVTNIRRGMFWSYREEANTDRRYETYSRYRKREINEAAKRDFLILMHRFPMMVVYRLMVVWILPVGFLVLLIAELLIATRILGDFGKTLEQFLSNYLGGFIGDVSAYAMDPSLALRIRSAVEYDIRYFHHMPQVSNIHIIAHSQGTPITFETIFTHMPKEYRRKIKTYVTIGSVLGYYYQTVPMLDEVYFPERFRNTDYELTTFAKGFRWFNCWNLADNVTGFYGLDEYDLEQLKMDPDDREEIRHPTNIKTRTRGHSDYWTNLDEVQVPFARRVLYSKVDEKWKPTIKVKAKIHKIIEPVAGLFFGILGALMMVWLYFLTRALPSIDSYIGGIFGTFVNALKDIKSLETIIIAIENPILKLMDQIIEVFGNSSTITQLGIGIVFIFIIAQIISAIMLWRRIRSIP